MKSHLGASFGLSQSFFFWIIDEVKCKLTFNINVVNFLMVHFVIELRKPYWKIQMSFLKKWTQNEIWNDDNIYVTHIV